MRRTPLRLGAALAALATVLVMSGCDYWTTCVRGAATPSAFTLLLQAALCSPTSNPALNPIVPHFRILEGQQLQDVTAVTSGSLVTLDGSPSYIAAPDNRSDWIQFFQWDLHGEGQPTILGNVLGPIGQPPADGELAQVRFNASAPKQMTITMIAHDALGLSEPVTRVLTVYPAGSQPGGPDVPPVARFIATPNPATPGRAVSFDATGTTDQHGTVTQYTWDFGDGTPALDSGSSAMVAHTYECTGRLTVTLTAANDAGQTGQARVALLVTPQAGARPCPGSGPAAAFTAGPNPAAAETAVTFDASASSDSAGPITDYFWEFGDGTHADSADPTITHSYFCTGALTVKLTIADAGAMSDQTTRTQTISPTQGFETCPAGQARDAIRSSQPAGFHPFFAARLVHTRFLSRGTLSRHGSATTVRGLVVAGSLRGNVIGWHGLRRFDDARFVAVLTIVMNSVRHAITIQGVALATIAGAGHGQLCLSLGVTRRGGRLPVGSFRALGGTGAAARLSGGGRFAFALGPGGGRLAGRLHVASPPRAGRRRVALSAACQSLQGLAP